MPVWEGLEERPSLPNQPQIVFVGWWQQLSQYLPQTLPNQPANLSTNTGMPRDTATTPTATSGDTLFLSR